MFKFKLNHIALSVKNVSRSIQFYQKVLQLKEIKNTASTSKTRWLLLNENTQLHLIPRPNSEIRLNKAVHFALSTGHFKDMVDRLKYLDIPYSDWRDTAKKDYVRDDGINQVYFQDLDGYWIEINNDI